MIKTKCIAEAKNFIILDEYTKIEPGKDYQDENELEDELVEDLKHQGYEYFNPKNQEEMRANVRVQLENLNNIKFTDREWERFLKEYLDRPGENNEDKSDKIYNDYIKDFKFDNGNIVNIYLFYKGNKINKEDKIDRTLADNKLQVIRQFEQRGEKCSNRYDVTILVNGLPLVHIELKRRGVPIKEAFNQIHRYSKESFNSDNSLYKFVQIFVISNGTDTRYFANTTERNKKNYDFTINWARSDNESIQDIKDFTATFFDKNTLLQVLLQYSVLDEGKKLFIMRPYQIAATERILDKIKSSFYAKKWNKPECGGYIFHSTGSGKTLTSFKVACLVAKMRYIDKVLFVVDRKDLDYQTMKKYDEYSKGTANGSSNTKGLVDNLEKQGVEDKIIVTTIQKLNNLMRTKQGLAVYNKQVVFIFDECHRSQFGEAQRNLRKKFKRYYQFGFTGTPILPKNAYGTNTTGSVFGRELHRYSIGDAIRDKKVLAFKLEYNNVRPKFKGIETEKDLEKLSALEDDKEGLMHPERIEQVSQYILNNFHYRTKRLHGNKDKGFNAMFAVSSVKVAKLYYKTLNRLQKESDKPPLKIATIFSIAPNEALNEAPNSVGEIQDESLEVPAMESSSKEFLEKVIKDYNSSYSLNSSNDFERYYQDLSRSFKDMEIDLLIVVGMFLTGFDAPRLNTLFVDKNLRYHGLIQAYSRTNRIYNDAKNWGNIITFRYLDDATKEAIKLFGGDDKKTILIEKKFKEQIEGLIPIINKLNERFPDPTGILEVDKKEFVEVFGKYIRAEDTLQNYGDFYILQALQKIDTDDAQALEDFKSKHHLSKDMLTYLKDIKLPDERKIQDYKSIYNDTYESYRRKKEANEEENSDINWDDITFEVELLRRQEVDLDYILELLLEKEKEDKENLIKYIQGIIRSIIDNRPKEDLLVNFIKETDLHKLEDSVSVIDAFYQFARKEGKEKCQDSDYILGLFLEKKKENKENLIKYMQGIIRSTIDNRPKEDLLVNFIKETDLHKLEDSVSVIDAFYQFARKEGKRECQELINSEELNEEEANWYINNSIENGFATENGMDLYNTLPKMSPLNPEFLPKKNRVFEKINAFVKTFKGVGLKL
ncbi:type I restriction enzyme EcoR124II R protein [Elysia marginata]|uniref:type I site-specific deoxyribonuclease n=1 Tax=Elysia marginata TaxID=1093978 RepID=A0AAV4FMK4_9GAST|nr:type I restriction enzyme EcoR124II R protein [Elysia marginata]